MPRGRGVPRDYAQAAALFRRAANAGSAIGRYDLALLHLSGEGVSVDVLESARLLRESSRQGNVKSMTLLASMIEAGAVPALSAGENQTLRREAALRGDRLEIARLVPPEQRLDPRRPVIIDAARLMVAENCQDCRRTDVDRSAREYVFAATEGTPGAIYELAVRNRDGDGIPKDLREAARLFATASRMGHAPSQYELARMRISGIGIAVDKREAEALLIAASRAKGETSWQARDLRRRLEMEMSTGEMADAMKRADEKQVRTGRPVRPPAVAGTRCSVVTTAMAYGIGRLRGKLAAAGVACLLLAGQATGAAAQDAPLSIVSLLQGQVSSKSCARHESALKGTLARLNEMKIPVDGRLILVNIASRTLAAYENGNPVVESRVVIGKEGWRTPDLSTVAEYVRLNPTWTVPESIVKANNWRSKLAGNPGYFARNGFDVVVGGKAIDPRDIYEDEVAKATFVQRPSAENALGRIKIGLIDSGGVYLHDTNDKAAYDRKGVESHGCIRVENIRELAAWVLGKQKSDIDDMLKDGDKTNRKPEAPVRVVVGYFTAWPDGEGKVHYYRDIYNRDPHDAACRSNDGDVENPYGSSRASFEPPVDDDRQKEEDTWHYD